MSTIVIGVDASERSEDAIAFGGRVAAASGARVVVACAYPSTRGNASLRDVALDTAFALSQRLDGVPAHRISIRALAGSPAAALHELAVAENASLIVVGSTHTGVLGRVHPGSTAERLLPGAPCAIAVVPSGYARHAIERIGVAYDGSPESRAALKPAVTLARAFDAELELIGVATCDWYVAGGVAIVEQPHEAVEQQLRERLDDAASDLPARVTTTLRSGDPAEQLAARSDELDLLITGSRGYGPLRAVIAGGVSGRVIRRARCPVVVVPRGVEAALTQAA